MTRWPTQFVGVGITGRAGSGKTTIARAILNLRHDWRSDSFAAALKSDLATLRCYKGDPGFREVAQAYGTEFMRGKYGPNVWFDRLVRHAGGSLDGLVIDDMRFQNETDGCKAAGLLLVEVLAPADVRRARLGYDCPDHPSETPPEGVHFRLHNDGSRTPDEMASEILTFARIPTIRETA